MGRYFSPQRLLDQLDQQQLEKVVADQTWKTKHADCDQLQEPIQMQVLILKRKLVR